MRQYDLALNRCIGLGVFFGLLSAGTWTIAALIVGLRFPGWGAFLAVVLSGAGGGCLVGLTLGLVCAPLISKRRPAQVTMWMLAVVSPVVVTSAVIGHSALIVLGAPALVFVSTCGILNRVLKELYPPGSCQNCGYDLTGNESGVCPECGTKIKEATR
jgi:hypothetical protein